MASGLGKRRNGISLNAVFDQAHIYCAAFVGDPGVAGTSGTEITDSAYVAFDSVPANWTAASDADPCVISNAVEISYPAAAAAWAGGSAVTHIGFYTHATLRTEQYYEGRAELTEVKTVPIGVELKLAIGSVTAQILS